MTIAVRFHVFSKLQCNGTFGLANFFDLKVWESRLHLKARLLATGFDEMAGVDAVIDCWCKPRLWLVYAFLYKMNSVKKAIGKDWQSVQVFLELTSTIKSL